MTNNPMEWSTFATEIEMYQRLREDFEDVSLFHIPRSRNGRADTLAKETKNKSYIFSHIDQIRIDRCAPRRIGSSATTWSSLDGQLTKKKYTNFVIVNPMRIVNLFFFSWLLWNSGQAFSIFETICLLKVLECHCKLQT